MTEIKQTANHQGYQPACMVHFLAIVGAWSCVPPELRLRFVMNCEDESQILQSEVPRTPPGPPGPDDIGEVILGIPSAEKLQCNNLFH